MNTLNENFSNFDFHESTPDKNLNSQKIYEAFLQCQQSLKDIPKSHRDKNPDISLHRLLKESIKNNQDGSQLFRKNPEAKDSIAQYWLSHAREAAYFYEAWKKPPSFKGVDKKFLGDFARLSVDPNNIKKIEEILSGYGIIVVHERSIPGMKVDGACFLLATGAPVIALSLRYSRLDIYWFVLMHELAHIALHYEKLTTPILDDLDEESASDMEIEANLLAANSLIPRTDWRSSNVKYNASEREIEDFAKKVQTHPSVVIGRLRRETGRNDIFSKKLNFENSRKIIFGDE